MIVLGYDTETKGLEWFDPAQRAFLVSWADDRGSFVCSVDDNEGVAEFKRAVERADVLVAHNESFDVHQIRETLGLDLLTTGKPCIDTDLLARIVLPERAWGGGGYKLKDLATTYLRADAQAAEEAIIELGESIGVKLKGENATIGAYYEVWRAYPAEMEHYAKLDAEYARDLLPILEAKLTDRSRVVWDVECQMCPVVIRAEQRGVRVDPTVVEQLRAEYAPKQQAAAELVEKELGDVNLNSPKQLAEALVKHGVPLHRTTDGGELSTAHFALQEFADDFPLIKALLEFRAADKMLGTYIGPMTGREIVHTSFWQIGAKTGRMSCSRPNMQNLPSHKEDGDTKLREVFIPREGHVFVVCDYDSIELRLLAYYLNDPSFQERVAGGLTFEWLATEVWGGEISDYVKGGRSEKKRSDAKNTTYAIVYGAGAGRISDMLDMPPGPPLKSDAWMVQRGFAKEGDPSYEPARQLIKKVKSTLPGYMKFAGPKGRVQTKIRQTGKVTTIMGRTQAVSEDKAYAGPNAVIQGSAADIFKKGVVDAVAATTDLGAHPVLFVHDELVLEVPAAHGEECLRRTIAAMSAAYPLKPPLEVSGSVAVTNYAEGK